MRIQDGLLIEDKMAEKYKLSSLQPSRE